MYKLCFMRGEKFRKHFISSARTLPTCWISERKCHFDDLGYLMHKNIKVAIFETASNEYFVKMAIFAFQQTVMVSDFQKQYHDVIKWKNFLCAGNSSVTDEFPEQRPVTRSFDVFFDLRTNKRWCKPSRCW